VRWARGRRGLALVLALVVSAGIALRLVPSHGPLAHALAMTPCPPASRQHLLSTARGWTLWCVAAGALHGPMTVWSRAGVKLEERWYRQGARHGPWRRWSASGALELEGAFADDRETGTWRYAELDGRELRVRFEDGWPVPPGEQGAR